MTLHRGNEPCASCHKIMDPIGFALENFDADGKLADQGWEATAELRSMRPANCVMAPAINGPVGLRQALLRYSPQFVRMLTEKLMTYALGRGVEYFDMPVIRSIVRDAAQGQQPVFVNRDGHRQERAISDENESGTDVSN